MAELLGTGIVNGVVDGGAAAGAGLDDFVAQASGIIGERLDESGLIVEGHDESLILIVADHAEQEGGGGVLLEFKAVADAVGSVHEQADAEREIGLAAE